MKELAPWLCSLHAVSLPKLTNWCCDLELVLGLYTLIVAAACHASILLTDSVSLRLYLASNNLSLHLMASSASNPELSAACTSFEMNHLISCVQNKTFIVECVLSATILTHVRWGPEWLVWLETSNLRLAFFIFEMAVGLYFPMMGTMKGQIVPESGSKFAWRSFPQFCLCCL